MTKNENYTKQILKNYRIVNYTQRNIIKMNIKITEETKM